MSEYGLRGNTPGRDRGADEYARISQVLSKAKNALVANERSNNAKFDQLEDNLEVVIHTMSTRLSEKDQTLSQAMRSVAQKDLEKAELASRMTLEKEKIIQMLQTKEKEVQALVERLDKLNEAMRKMEIAQKLAEERNRELMMQLNMQDERTRAQIGQISDQMGQMRNSSENEIEILRQNKDDEIQHLKQVQDLRRRLDESEHQHRKDNEAFEAEIIQLRDEVVTQKSGRQRAEEGERRWREEQHQLQLHIDELDTQQGQQQLIIREENRNIREEARRRIEEIEREKEEVRQQKEDEISELQRKNEELRNMNRQLEVSEREVKVIHGKITWEADELKRKIEQMEKDHKNEIASQIRANEVEVSAVQAARETALERLGAEVQFERIGKERA
ncbi:MAG: hypothetical protein EZS28_003976, partial [Streblomastix strix]